jgi:hypothetical protein
MPLLTRSALKALRTPSLWIPALILLAPTLAIQLAAPWYLRTRLAPALWTVALGSLLLIWLAQVAWPVVCVLVQARRERRPAHVTWPVFAVALSVGTWTTLGLTAGVLPGLWLQARHAFAALVAAREGSSSSFDALRDGMVESSRVRWPLFWLAAAALVVSVLGQSGVAVLAEALGTIRPGNVADGRTLFVLAYTPHALTSVLAYLTSAFAVTMHAVGVSIMFAEVHGLHVEVSSEPTPRVLGVVLRIAASLVLMGALAAAAYKVHQHLF